MSNRLDRDRSGSNDTRFADLVPRTSRIELGSVDPIVDFEWGMSSGIESDKFRAGLDRAGQPAVTGAHRFYVRSDDVVRLGVKGRLASVDPLDPGTVSP
ncbi:MAG TPA: hypothetical protein VEK15_06230 [Vicinamibacteria bacterium]|nr:hypothetical protein [Vicinamibacteria bacterium]